jgi:tetratricopeptide (TPR) repeat protein
MQLGEATSVDCVGSEDENVTGLETQKSEAASEEAEESTPGHERAEIGGAENTASAAEDEKSKEQPEATGTEAKGSSEKSWLLWLSDRAKAVFAILSSTFLSILLIVLIVLLGVQLARRTVFLDLVEVPKDFRDKGLTANALSGELADNVVEILEIAQSKETTHFVEPAWSQPDIQVPGSTVSLRSVAQFLKHYISFFGLRDDLHISGELTETGDGLRFSLRKSGGTVNDSIVITWPNKDLNALLSSTAEGVVKLVDAATLASYYYQIEDRTKGYQKTTSALKYAIGSGTESDRARAYNLWGGVLADEDKPTQALAMLRRALDYDSNLAEAYMNWADILSLALNSPDLAIPKYQKALHLNKQLVPAYNGYGNALDSIGKSDEAVLQYNTAIKTDPKNFWPYLNLASVLRREGDRVNALELYEKARELAQEKIYKHEEKKASNGNDFGFNPDPYQALTIIFNSTGRLNEAIGAGKDAVKVDETDPNSHLYLGQALENANQFDEADINFRKAAELRAKWTDPIRGEADIFFLRGEYDNAARTYASVVAGNPTDSGAWDGWGNTLGAVSDGFQAIPFLHLAARISNLGGEIDMDIADAMAKAGRYPAAVNIYRRVTAVNKGSIAVHVHLGNALSKLRKWDDAIREYTAGAGLAEKLELAFHSVGADYGLDVSEYDAWGDALNSLGHPREAATKYQRALALSARDVGAYIGLSVAQAAMREIDKAIATAKSAVAINGNNYWTN